MEYLALLGPLQNWIYVLALFIGLWMSYGAAKANGKTNANSFADYWLKETPGASQATVIALVAAAGTVIESGMLSKMDLWGVALFGFSKAFTFDTAIQFPVPGSKSDGAAATAAQKGFATVPFMASIAALSLAVALFGCGVFSTGKSAVLDVPAEKSLPAIAQQAQTAVNAANATLATVYTFVRDGLRDGTLATPDARRIKDKADEFSRDVDQAQSLINAGSFDAAQAKAAATQALIKILHDEAVAAAKKRSGSTSPGFSPQVLHTIGA